MKSSLLVDHKTELIKMDSDLSSIIRAMNAPEGDFDYIIRRLKALQNFVQLQIKDMEAMAE